MIAIARRRVPRAAAARGGLSGAEVAVLASVPTRSTIQTAREIRRTTTGYADRGASVAVPQITRHEYGALLLACARMFPCGKAPGLAGGRPGGASQLTVDPLLQAASEPVAAGGASGTLAGRAAVGRAAARAEAALDRRAP